MLLTAIISFLIFHGYLATVWFKYGPTFSISNTYYALPQKYNFLFTIFMWSYSTLMLIPAIELFSTPIIFLTIACIWFVGGAAAFRKNVLTENVHMGAAEIAALGSFLSLIFDFKYYLLAIITFILTGMVYYFGGKKVFLPKVYVYLGELIMFESIYIALFIKLLS